MLCTACTHPLTQCVWTGHEEGGDHEEGVGGGGSGAWRRRQKWMWRWSAGDLSESSDGCDERRLDAPLELSPFPGALRAVY